MAPLLPRRRARRRRALLLGALALLLAVGLVLVLWPSGTNAGRHSATASTKPVARPPTTTSPTTPLAVTTSSLALSDPDRPLVIGGTEVAATRSLPTTLVAPTRGRWPLVVFVHGYDVGPATYTRFLDSLASQGYVVAAPSFPLEDPAPAIR